MSKIITTEEPDIELDPESMTDNLDMFEALSVNKNKMLEAIRDLDHIIENGDTASYAETSAAPKKKEKSINCFIRIESKFTNNSFNMNFKLIGLNQNVVERSATELELEADEKKLVKLFSFYQSNVYKQKLQIGNQFKVLLGKTKMIKRKKKLITKNDVFLTKLYANIDGKRVNLINCVNQAWRINEMKYAFDNNRSTIKVLFVRNK